MAYFTDLKQIFQKFIWNQKRLQNLSNLKKEEQSKSDHNTQFQTILQSHLIKTNWYWHKNRHIDQWKRIQNPEINPRFYCQLIFNKGSINMQWNKDSFFNKWCWENWTGT